MKFLSSECKAFGINELSQLSGRQAREEVSQTEKCPAAGPQTRVGVGQTACMIPKAGKPLSETGESENWRFLPISGVKVWRGNHTPVRPPLAALLHAAAL